MRLFRSLLHFFLTGLHHLFVLVPNYSLAKSWLRIIRSSSVIITREGAVGGRGERKGGGGEEGGESRGGSKVVCVVRVPPCIHICVISMVCLLNDEQITPNMVGEVSGKVWEISLCIKGDLDSTHIVKTFQLKTPYLYLKGGTIIGHWSCSLQHMSVSL